MSFEPFKRLHEPRRAALSINGESVVMPPSAVPPAPLEHKEETDGGGGVGGCTALAGKSIPAAAGGACDRNGRYTNVTWARFGSTSNSCRRLPPSECGKGKAG